MDKYEPLIQALAKEKETKVRQELGTKIQALMKRDVQDGLISWEEATSVANKAQNWVVWQGLVLTGFFGGVQTASIGLQARNWIVWQTIQNHPEIQGDETLKRSVQQLMTECLEKGSNWN